MRQHTWVLPVSEGLCVRSYINRKYTTKRRRVSGLQCNVCHFQVIVFLCAFAQISREDTAQGMSGGNYETRQDVTHKSTGTMDYKNNAEPTVEVLIKLGMRLFIQDFVKYVATWRAEIGTWRWWQKGPMLPASSHASLYSSASQSCAPRLRLFPPISFFT